MTNQFAISAPSQFQEMDWSFGFGKAAGPIDIRDIFEADELPFTHIVEVTELIPTRE